MPRPDSRLGAWDAASGKALWERALVVSRVFDGKRCWGTTERSGPACVPAQRRNRGHTRTTPRRARRFRNAAHRSPAAHIVYAPDRHYMVGRWANRLDLRRFGQDGGAVAQRSRTILRRWQQFATLEFTPEMQLRDMRARTKRRNPQSSDGSAFFDVATGKRRGAGGDRRRRRQSEARGLFLVTEHGYTISRLRPIADGNVGADPVWTTKPPAQRGVDYMFKQAITSGSFFHGIFILRNFDSGIRDQMALRTLSWDSGPAHFGTGACPARR